LAKNKYAIVMTSTDGLRECFTAAFNGLEIYGSSVDVYLIASGIDKEWLVKLPSNYTVVPWEDIEDTTRVGKNRGAAWEVRFYRYRYAARINDDYEAIMILDADSFIVNNIDHLFEQSVAEQRIIAPKNPRGIPIEQVTLDKIGGASSPSFHSTPFVYPTKTYKGLMDDIYLGGLTEDLGDMSTMFRTLMRHNKHTEVIMTKNEQYVLTNWFYIPITKKLVDNKLELYHNEDRISVVHGKWAIDRYTECYLKEPKNQVAGQWRDIGEQNSKTFIESIHWLNENGPINWKVSPSEEEGKA